VSASQAARLGATNLAVHSILMTTAGIFYNIPLGIATAASIRIGQFLGGGRGDRAKDMSRLALVLNSIFPLVSGALLVGVFNHAWVGLFTKDQEVLTRAAETMPIMMLYLFTDHVKCVCMAILRGCGRAPITVYGNTLSCWVVGFPMAYILVFNPYQFKLYGLWTSMSAAWATASVVYFIVIYRTDWSEEVDSARQRNERSLAAGESQPREQDKLASDAQRDAEADAADSVASRTSSHMRAPKHKHELVSGKNLSDELSEEELDDAQL
jgi:MATE family multidrug resistance protein